MTNDHAPSVWDLFAKAQHLHFENGDLLVLTTRDYRLRPEQLDYLREQLAPIADGVRILIIEPDVEIHHRPGFGTPDFRPQTDLI